MMNEARENLKQQIEKIEDEDTIEKVRIFIMGILSQQSGNGKQGGMSERVG